MSIALAKDSLNIMQGSFSVENDIVLPASEVDLQECMKKYFPDCAQIVIWHMHAVVWGVLRDGSMQFADGSELDTDTILELRVFNDKAELHLTKNAKCFAGRYIKDEGEQVIKYVDSLARFWGEKCERRGEFVELKDAQRKLVLTVPCEEEASFYGLVTRNYIGYAPQNGQAGYVDYRYVAITSAEGGK